jgi:FdhD protein
MGLELARELGIIMIARAKGRHFLIYHGADDVVLDEPPMAPPTPRDSRTASLAEDA